MREIGGRNVRFTASPETARFGLGTWASISETLSTAGFGAGSGTAGGGVGGAFLAVIGTNADFVAGAAVGAAVIAGAAFAPALVPTATSSLVVLELLAGLTGARARIDDLAEVAGFATLMAEALGAVVLVVVFVAIQVP
jgi:hypothetical protein